ncbi:MAG: hypothetical protein H7Y17_08565 [Chlorobia bacterium]|nr:hypothetical protein [Fimbriimonadaceae bacterium]
MTNRDRAWRRRQRFFVKVDKTREWVNEQVEKTTRAVKTAAKQPAKITLKAQHHIAKRAQAMREGWRANQDVREAWE